MKVGLVPLLYNEYNYGGVLQFYALQRILKKNNIDCDIIFYNNDEKVSYYELPVIKKIILKTKVFVANSINKKQENINTNIENR